MPERQVGDRLIVPVTVSAAEAASEPAVTQLPPPKPKHPEPRAADAIKADLARVSAELSELEDFAAKCPGLLAAASSDPDQFVRLSQRRDEVPARRSALLATVAGLRAESKRREAIRLDAEFHDVVKQITPAVERFKVARAEVAQLEAERDALRADARAARQAADRFERERESLLRPPQPPATVWRAG